MRQAPVNPRYPARRERLCILCGDEIHECMGSVLARDSNRAEAGEIPWRDVREHCGRCTTFMVNAELISPMAVLLVQGYLRALQ